jgi:hypothetical protein
MLGLADLAASQPQVAVDAAPADACSRVVPADEGGALVRLEPRLDEDEPMASVGMNTSMMRSTSVGHEMHGRD